MSEAQDDSTDPSLASGNTAPPRDVDLKSPEVLEFLKQHGRLYRRKIEPIKGVRDPEVPEEVKTVVNGITESIQVAEPGRHKIITGSKGEEFVFTTEKFEGLYVRNDNGQLVPRERHVLAMPNPYSQPIRIEAPWSTKEDPQYQEGTAQAIMTFGLDDTGELTDDRYLIGDQEMLLNNYEPVSPTNPV